MTTTRKFKPIIFCVIMIFAVHLSPAYGGVGSFFDSIKKQVIGTRALPESDIINGLKEALSLGTSNAVSTVSQADGFFKNPDIKIPLPDTINSISPLIKSAGFGSYIDEFELSMNRAAEEAAPEAGALFMDAIQKMTFTDAKKILDGPDTAATDYFKDKTSEPLAKIFKPIINKSMSATGATRAYQDLNSKIQTIPFAESQVLDIDQYATDRAIDGLFHMISLEEQKIRLDPAARTTDLLKKVFNK
ncbi:MAG: DUF4197 domain-containing protein [Desulfobacterales bacterium]|nr:DUF4197 domain-containing protein [Desulfobacterales bacterium]MDD4071766.1 DUF4197 domain-containing protein [Desulfobacterales bacterium]MDD4391976.1 DUF4197 domain-containing protein [Desulfobacterales bacterium]